eukprot:5805986-Lingulodinium_polyedra.AAC.1
MTPAQKSNFDLDMEARQRERGMAQQKHDVALQSGQREAANAGRQADDKEMRQQRRKTEDAR